MIKNSFAIKFKNLLIEKAKKINKRILFPEGNELRIIKTAAIADHLGIAQCILLGDQHIIYDIVCKEKINFSKNIIIINPKDIYQNYVETLFCLRKCKGMTVEDAKLHVQDNMVLGTLMLYNNETDGIVCGVKYSSADVLRTALQIIGPMSNVKSFSLVSSIFFMLLQDRVVIYTDCAINIDPDADQLSNIAILAANLAIQFDITPKIAMLSYSTGYSGSGITVDKVRKATKLLKYKRPDLIVDGPIQYDAAVNKSISSIKLKKSNLNGEATIFTFPDLNSGNITYKAVQQVANITSIGPILQGLNKPVNDLSRGAEIDDILYTIAVTVIQTNKSVLHKTI